MVIVATMSRTVLAQQTIRPPTQCPVLASLASSKVHNQTGDDIVIWFWNQSTKATHGTEFSLVMLDAAGNRYPASKRYVATGGLKPQSGDIVVFSAKDEEQFFGQTWADIDGIEVHVVSVMFKDATTWRPKRGVVCKTAFINADYDAEVAKRGRIIDRQMKAWRKKHNLEHRNQGYINSGADECPTSEGAEVFDAQGTLLDAIPDQTSIIVSWNKKKKGFHWVQGLDSDGQIARGYVREGCVAINQVPEPEADSKK